ncbi:hypothetical protein [Flavobacterium sp. HNIBRBA15423]|uniref:hypothetical protein n=1 Tax=Flavobacterium sp. HNIBRBA15423 TaxID=3458683 RepID=UPI0040449D3E
MKKSILNLQGAQELSKKEQKSVNGGRRACNLNLPNAGCGSNECCSKGICYPYGTPGHLCTYYPEI